MDVLREIAFWIVAVQVAGVVWSIFFPGARDSVVGWVLTSLWPLVVLVSVLALWWDRLGLFVNPRRLSTYQERLRTDEEHHEIGGADRRVWFDKAGPRLWRGRWRRTSDTTSSWVFVRLVGDRGLTIGRILRNPTEATDRPATADQEVAA